MDITNEQWEFLEPLIPQPEVDALGRGRPRCPDRDVLNGILWVLRTGAPWADLPDRYPSSSTCHKRFQEWIKDNVFGEILAALRRDLATRGGIQDIESFIDGTYVPAKKGALRSVSPARARPRNSWRLQTAMVFHSLSLLRTDPNTTSVSPTELSTLLSSMNSHLNLLETKPGTAES